MIVDNHLSLTGEVTKESNVYSFGIVLLELLTGKRPMMFTQDEDIVKWVTRQLQKDQIAELLEPKLLELDTKSSKWEEFLLGIKVGLLCTSLDPLDRPSMADIVLMLQGCRSGLIYLRLFIILLFEFTLITDSLVTSIVRDNL